MELFEFFPSKEELFNALTAAIDQDEESRFYLRGVRDTHEQLIQQTKETDQYRLRAEEAETQIQELQNRLAGQAAVLNELDGFQPREIRDRLKSMAAEKANLLIETEKLRQKLGPLVKENEQYRQRESHRTICQALREAAERTGIRQEAFRDVERLASQFKMNDDGTIRTESGADITTVLEQEKALSPHWLPISQGGGSTENPIHPFAPSLYTQAKESGDLNGMIINAPVIDD